MCHLVSSSPGDIGILDARNQFLPILRNIEICYFVDSDSVRLFGLRICYLRLPVCYSRYIKPIKCRPTSTIHVTPSQGRSPLLAHDVGCLKLGSKLDPPPFACRPKLDPPPPSKIQHGPLRRYTRGESYLNCHYFC